MAPRRVLRCALAIVLTFCAVHAASSGPADDVPEQRPAIGSQQDADLILILTRSTLIGLHRANISGNYSTLRDLAAPRLKDRFTAADLSLAFAALRRHGIYLEAAAILEPEYSPEPYIDRFGALRIAGWMKTEPENVNFDLAFEAVNGSWLLLDVSVRPSDGPPPPRSGGESASAPAVSPITEFLGDLRLDGSGP